MRVYDARVAARIQAVLDIANNQKDRRRAALATHVNTAIARANAENLPADPSPEKLVAWRTSGSGSPGAGFTFYKTVLGNDFYWMS